MMTKEEAIKIATDYCNHNNFPTAEVDYLRYFKQVRVHWTIVFVSPGSPIPKDSEIPFLYGPERFGLDVYEDGSVEINNCDNLPDNPEDEQEFF